MDFGARDEAIGQELTEGGGFSDPAMVSVWVLSSAEERVCSYFFGELCRIIDSYEGNEYILKEPYRLVHCMVPYCCC
jgi:hypothetical protein